MSNRSTISNEQRDSLQRTRRSFLTSFAGGIGGAALASLLTRDGHALEATPTGGLRSENPFAPRPGHFAAKAKSCIFIYLVGGPSQVDLFDPKPKLAEMAGQTLPESIVKDARTPFLLKNAARVMPSKYKFSKHGECGMEISELLPHLGTIADDITLVRSMQTDAVNHHPGELLMNTGHQIFGRPSMGSWINYGLGSECDNLPGYVVLTAGYASTAGASSWSSGFLPSTYQGTLFRNSGEAVLSLDNPTGICPTVQGKTIQAVSKLNAMHGAHVLDPEVDSQIRAYELAYKMQASVPRLTNIRNETDKTIEDYGLLRELPTDTRGWEGGGLEAFDKFARNCLMARRLVEQGVRFVNVYHSRWDDHSCLEQNLPLNCQVVDQPIVALVKDLKQRGLLDTTLVVCASEFGRTPLAENKLGNLNSSGRAHHPYAFSIWMAGGGIKAGQVVGKTDDIGWGVVENPIHVHDLHATILHLFGLDHERLTFRFRGRDMRLTDFSGRVVPELLA